MAGVLILFFQAFLEGEYKTAILLFVLLQIVSMVLFSTVWWAVPINIAVFSALSVLVYNYRGAPVKYLFVLLYFLLTLWPS